MVNSKILSVILLSYYSNNRINIVYEKLTGILEKEEIPFELIIVDDGSKDDSYKTGLALENKYPNVKAYQLSRNYTSHYGIFAGFSVCLGACAVAIPDDEQQPYNLLVESYRLWEKGHKIIIPFREERKDGFFSKMWAMGFYSIMNYLSDVALPPKGADTCFIDREIIDILNERIHPINTTTITEIIRLGFEPFYLPYIRPEGIAKKSRWTFKKKFKLAKDYFFSSSTFPIRFITFLGLFFSVFSFLIMLVYIYAKLFGNPVFWDLEQAPGWTSTILLISFFSGLILFSLGIIAEYIWRIYEEVKNRPGYIIKKKSDTTGVNY
jgi:polyisoprenyl-phosphate glycosyltransferase